LRHASARRVHAVLGGVIFAEVFPLARINYPTTLEQCVICLFTSGAKNAVLIFATDKITLDIHYGIRAILKFIKHLQHLSFEGEAA
jgi:hypothetical protein